MSRLAVYFIYLITLTHVLTYFSPKSIIRVALENVDDDIREEATHALETMREEGEHEVLYSDNWEG